jgi:hypothetical protein
MKEPSPSSNRTCGRAEPRCRMGIFTTEAGSVEQKVWCCGTLAAGFYFPPNFAFSVSLR